MLRDGRLLYTVQEAIDIVQENIPIGKIQVVITYGNLYLFQVFTDRAFEEEMDPFYSVHQKTGVFKDFSIITDGDTAEIVSLFEEAKLKKKGV